MDEYNYMPCELSIVTGGEELRTDVIDGHFMVAPREGLPFVMMAKPINPDAIGRLIITSLVQEIISVEEDDIVFRTLNSTYKLTATDKEDEHYDANHHERVN